MKFLFIVVKSVGMSWVNSPGDFIFPGSGWVDNPGQFLPVLTLCNVPFLWSTVAQRQEYERVVVRFRAAPVDGPLEVHGDFAGT